MNLPTNLNLTIVLDLTSLLVTSFFLHFFLFTLIKISYLGNPHQNSLYYRVLLRKQNLLIIYIFFISLFLISYSNENLIFLEDKVVNITTNIDNIKFEFSGDLLNKCFQNLGAAGVFSAGAKIAASLVAKHKIGILPKTGIIVATSVGLSASYKIISQTVESSPSLETVKVETGKISICVESINKTNNNPSNFLSECFGVLKIVSLEHSPLSTNTSTNNSINTNRILRADQNISFNQDKEQTAEILNQLDICTPNWRDQFNVFINSPLESNNGLTQFVLDALNNHLIINYITVYLLLVLLFLNICKYLLNKDIKLNRLEKYNLGIYIKNFLIKYISIWQKTGNFWTFFIIIFLIIFNSVVTISTYFLIIKLAS